MTSKPLPWENIDIVCEGLTEVLFIKKIVNPYLAGFQINLNNPIDMQGGVSVDTVLKHIKNIRHPKNRRHHIVTTFVDYYGFKGNTGKSIEDLERDLKAGSPKEHFIPYIQKHETEALWFSDISIIASVMNASASQRQELEKIEKAFDTPEDINNSPETAPSKRLEALFRGYNKITDGLNIADGLGIEKMREKCPRFDAWLKRLIESANTLRGNP
jgi:hypothetical protein